MRVAARLKREAQTGVNRSTLFRAYKSGRISATRADTGQIEVDPAELLRVFPSPRHHGGRARQAAAAAAARAIDLRKQKIGTWRQAAAPNPAYLGSNTFIEFAVCFWPHGRGGRIMIGQTFTLIGSPKLVFRLVWRGSIAGIDCVRGVALNGKFQTLRRAVDVVFVEAA
jgi:hypothetical protein